MYFLPKPGRTFVVCLHTKPVHSSALSWLGKVKPSKLIDCSAADESQLRNYGP